MTKQSNAIEVFLSLRTGRKRDGSAVFHNAEWVSQRGHGELYRSKQCDTQEQAIELALAWLRKQPEGRYVDVTRQPERFGYSHDERPAAERVMITPDQYARGYRYRCTARVAPSGRRCARIERHDGDHGVAPDRGTSVLSANVILTGTPAQLAEARKDESAPHADPAIEIGGGARSEVRKPSTVLQWIETARAAGHDALGLANDSEAIATLDKLRAKREATREAVTVGLALGLAAPDNARAQQAAAVAEALAADLSDVEVERCKREALARVADVPHAGSVRVTIELEISEPEIAEAFETTPERQLVHRIQSALDHEWPYAPTGSLGVRRVVVKGAR